MANDFLPMRVQPKAANVDRMPKSRKRRQSNPLALERMFDRPVNDTLKIPPAEAPKCSLPLHNLGGCRGNYFKSTILGYSP
jgi:hypothetical protein